MLCEVVLTFKSGDETVVCDHSNESYCVVLSCGNVYYAVQGGINVLSAWMKVLLNSFHLNGLSLGFHPQT